MEDFLVLEIIFVWENFLHILINFSRFFILYKYFSNWIDETFPQYLYMVTSVYHVCVITQIISFWMLSHHRLDTSEVNNQAPNPSNTSIIHTCNRLLGCLTSNENDHSVCMLTLVTFSFLFETWVRSNVYTYIMWYMECFSSLVDQRDL